MLLAPEIIFGPIDGHLRLPHSRELRDIEMFPRHFVQPELGQLGNQSLLSLANGQVGIDRLELDQRLARLDPISHVVQHANDAARFLAPTLTSSQPLSVPTRSTVVSTSFFSAGATVTGTTLGPVDAVVDSAAPCSTRRRPLPARRSPEVW